MFRFTIRDVLWLTALVAMAFGWAVDHSLQNRQIAKEKANSIEAAAQVQIEWLKRYRDGWLWVAQRTTAAFRVELEPPVASRAIAR